MDVFSDVDRRRFLKTAALGTVVGGTAGVFGSSRNLDSSETPEKYSGIPEQYLNGKERAEVIETVKHLFDVEDFRPEGYDLLVDARYVEGERFADQNIRRVESFFENYGFDLKFLEYSEEFSIEDFENNFEASTEDILSEEDESLYNRWVEDIMKDTAIQVFFIPGIETEYGEFIRNGEEIPGIEDLEQGDKIGADGVAFYDRTAISTDEYFLQDLDEIERNPDTKFYKTVHELLHTLGLEHTEDKNNVMYGNELRTGRRLELNNKQVKNVQDQLGI